MGLVSYESNREWGVGVSVKIIREKLKAWSLLFDTGECRMNRIQFELARK